VLCVRFFIIRLSQGQIQISYHKVNQEQEVLIQLRY